MKVLWMKLIFIEFVKNVLFLSGERRERERKKKMENKNKWTWPWFWTRHANRNGVGVEKMCFCAWIVMQHIVKYTKNESMRILRVAHSLLTRKKLLQPTMIYLYDVNLMILNQRNYSNLQRMENTTRVHVSRGWWHFYLIFQNIFSINY